MAPSAIPFDEDSKTPRALTTEEVKGMVEKFRLAVRRAVQAGFDAIEIHGAHGYLIHQFHSPLTNKRDDEYGQALTKFGREVIEAAKAEMPADMPLIMRISAREYVEGCYGIEECIEFSKACKDTSADVFEISSGGEGQIAAWERPGTHAAYQVPLARQIKEADLVQVGRGMLRNPYWTLEAAKLLRKENVVPKQYEAGF